jgi:hypothetical protein
VTELDEVADTLAPSAPRFASFDAASVWVRLRMPEETSTVVDGVAESLWRGQQAEA